MQREKHEAHFSNRTCDSEVLTHSATRTWSPDSCLFMAEEGNLGGLELRFKKKKKKREAQRGHAPSCLPLAHCQGTSGTRQAQETGGECPLPTVSGSLLSWQGLAIKYWPPWRLRSTVVSDEESRAPGSVLNTS